MQSAGRMNQASSLLALADGEMVRRVREKDWSQTPLGPLEQWPQSLRMAVGICLHSRFPMGICWGPQLINLYNDAFIPLLGMRHPDALGSSAPTTWSELWDIVRPQFEAVMQRAESTWNQRFPVVLERTGDPEEAYFTWSYSPIPDERGGVGGVLCTVTEETEHVRAEGALAEARRRLDSALIAGEVGTFEWEVAADRVWGDQNFARLFDIRLDATGAAPLADYLAAVHPDDRTEVMQRVRRTLETGSDYEAEYRIVNDGQTRWVITRGKSERDEAGRVARFPGVVLDVTARKQAEEALRASEARYRALFESIDEGFCVIQVLFDDLDRPVDYRFLETNPAWEKHTGLQDAVGRTARELLPDLEGHWFEIYGRVARTGEAIRFESGSDVMRRWFDVFAFRIEKPESREIALLFTDISEYKRADEALRRAAEADAFRLALSDALRSLVDPAEIQAAAARVLGEHLQASWVHYAEVGENGDVVDPRDYCNGVPSLAGTHRVTAYGPTLREEFTAGRRVVVSDVGNDPRLGEEEHAALGVMGIGSYVAVPLVKAGRLSALLAVHDSEPRDWSAAEAGLIEETAERTWEAVERCRAAEERERLLRETEAARAEAEAANRAKVDFLAAMSHELRTPLNAIGGYVDLLDLGIHGPVTEAQRTALTRIHANQRHLLTLINDILQFAKLEAGQVEFDPRRLGAWALLQSVEPLVAPSAAAKGVAYSARECDPSLGLIGDEERVRQILLNLITNAIKFTPAGGWVLLWCDTDAEWVCVRVRDNGPGIRPEDQRVIFDPFVQVGHWLNELRQGVGLGLAISRDLAHAMGGELSVESTPGEGSTFTLRLPRARDEDERRA
jgi:PAS domain S-box-containing protein